MRFWFPTHIVINLICTYKGKRWLNQNKLWLCFQYEAQYGQKHTDIWGRKCQLWVTAVLLFPQRKQKIIIRANDKPTFHISKMSFSVLILSIVNGGLKTLWMSHVLSGTGRKILLAVHLAQPLLTVLCNIVS